MQVSRKVPSGVWNVVRSRELGSKARWSNETNKLKSPYTELPAKCSTSCSTIGGTALSLMVTAFNGSRLWTIRRDFPSFLRTQNHRDRYEELEGSYTFELIFSLMILITLSYIPGGIGMFLRAHGMCSMVGTTIGSNHSSPNIPFSISFQAKASSCSFHIHSTNFSSSFQRKPSGLTSASLRRSSVYRLLGINLGGCVGRMGMSARGLGWGRRTIRKASGSVVATGRTFRSTFL